MPPEVRTDDPCLLVAATGDEALHAARSDLDNSPHLGPTPPGDPGLPWAEGLWPSRGTTYYAWRPPIAIASLVSRLPLGFALRQGRLCLAG